MGPSEAAALLRNAAGACFRWVRRDRGEGLYIAREPYAPDTSAPSSPGAAGLAGSGPRPSPEAPAPLAPAAPLGSAGPAERRFPAPACGSSPGSSPADARDDGLLDVFMRGGLFVLIPSEAGARACSALLPGCPDRSMAPFRAGSFPAEDLRLLARGLKLCEARAPGDAWRYLVDVHRRAAVLLREKRVAEGGALWVCAQLAHILEEG